MFNWKRPKVKISIARGVLDAIFDECDQFDVDETGGRIIGTYRRKGTHYDIEVLGVIGPGPNARRTRTSFFQDGEYQESVFRSVEKQHPEIEHLGNWHTHHVNGLSSLSSGDETTYRTIVNHHKHNTDFFYALLVVQKAPGRDERYKVKHYFLRRDDDVVYEIPEWQVRIADKPVLSPVTGDRVLPAIRPLREPEILGDANPERVKDQEFFTEFYPSLRPVFSKSLGAPYWKGRLDLIDGSQTDVLVIEHMNGGKRFYSISIGGQKLSGFELSPSYEDRIFKSARHAVLQLERDLNRNIYRNK